MEKLKKIIFLSFFISSIQVIHGASGVEFTNGNSNFFDLSSYNFLLKMQAKSKVYGISEQGGTKVPLRAQRDVHMQVSRAEIQKKGLVINGEFKILSIITNNSK